MIRSFDKRMAEYKKKILASNMPVHLVTAAINGLPTASDDARNFWLGAVGIRHDGVLVYAKNGSCNFSSSDQYLYVKENHAEGRIVRKMGMGSKCIYVSRINRIEGCFAMARPCGRCQIVIKSRKIDKVYYSINQEQYGVWDVKKDNDKVYSI